LDGANDGREDAILSSRATKVVANEVAGVIIDVEAVRDVVSVESKRFTRDGDGYPPMSVIHKSSQVKGRCTYDLLRQLRPPIPQSLRERPPTGLERESQAS
jgi:hypothetical protein